MNDDQSFGVFDIECQDWDLFVVGACLRDGVLVVFRDQDAMLDYMLAREGTWYAHNAGRYDGLWFLDGLMRRKIPCKLAITGSRLLRIQAGSTTVADSFAFIPMSLKKAAPMGGEAKAEVGLPCRCGKDCGGYCSIRKDMTEKRYKQVIGYLSQDCRSLHAVITFLRGWCADQGIDLRNTIGASAWATAKEWCDLPDAEWSRGDYALVRDAYFGGRTEVYRPKVDHGWRYDIHSSYPAALRRVAVPVGERTVIEDGAQARRAYRKGRPGVYAARVSIPECHIPPLPVRMRDRIAYPIGRASAAWTLPELNFAEECGVEIGQIGYAVVWESEDRIVAPYCERVWKLRNGAAKDENKALATWIKWLANSLTGKFAMNPGITNSQVCEGDPGGTWKQIHPHRNVWFQTVRRFHACGHVQFAAYLCSDARIELDRQLLEAEQAAVYCDTDSAYATRELDRRIGDDLGEWGCEGSMDEWIALAPKLYRYRDDKGEIHVRGKGLSGLTSEGFDRIAEGKAWETDRGVLSFRQAVQKGGAMFKRRTLRRKRSDPTTRWYGSRILGSDGLTHPADLHRILEDAPG